MKDRIWRLPPCPPYDVEGMESWLSDMAARGWKLEPDDFFFGIASFIKTDPAPVRYRLEASPQKVSGWDADGGVPEREAWELNTDCGWEYAGRRGQFFIYRTADQDAPELHTDPQVQALAVKAVEKRRTADLIILLTWLLALWILYTLRGLSVLLAAVMVGPSFLLTLALAVLLGLGILIAELEYLRRLRRKLQKGLPPDRQKDWRRYGRRHYALRAAFILLLVLYAVVSLRTVYTKLEHKDRTPLAEYTGKPPFATIANFTEGEYSETWGDIQYNHMSEWSNALLERGMEWRENGSVTRRDGSILSGMLIVDYFAARTEWLAALIAAECRRSDKARARKNYEPLTLPDLGLEEQAAYRNELHFPMVVLRRGKTVVRAMFHIYTSSDSSLSLEEWAGILAESLG